MTEETWEEYVGQLPEGAVFELQHNAQTGRLEAVVVKFPTEGKWAAHLYMEDPDEVAEALRECGVAFQSTGLN